MRWRRTRKGPVVATIVGLIALIACVGVAAWFYRDYNQRAADEARRAAELQRVAEAQRKAELDKSTSAAAQHEAKLLSELQAAKDALTQAEASKRKAEQDRTAAEAAQREARLQGELKAAKDALLKADASGKKADQERTAATTAMRAAESAVQKAVEPEPKVELKPEPKTIQAAALPPPASPLPQAATQGIARFDGRYPGRVCTPTAFESTDLRCWQLELTVKDGAFSGSWVSMYSGKQAYAKGTIAPDGRVEASLNSYNQRGRPTTASLKGAWNNETIVANGTWTNALPVRGAWARAQ
jgi:hypothetical protein